MEKRILSVMSVLLLLLALTIFAGCTGTTGTAGNTPAPTDNPAGEKIFVYSGAGLKGPMSEIGKVFTEKYGNEVEFTFAGSGVLISQMKTTNLGDVFIPGGQPDYKVAADQGLVVADPQLVAYHVPVIAVPKGNPKEIKDVTDLAKSGMRVALGDANATAIGKAGVKIFTKAGILDDVEKNVVMRGATINEVVTALASGNADVALLTKDNAKADKFDIIEIPVADNSILITPIGITTFTKNPTLAQKFADFTASDEGKAIFKKYGFPPYPDPKYTA
ncbi:MAG: molybdate ABC transporter substrate-binding protein [Methanomicrobium sp.]|nr:molybdate ABC transporter substrate-binding protein [Methanomicrobium sp.]